MSSAKGLSMSITSCLDSGDIFGRVCGSAKKSVSGFIQNRRASDNSVWLGLAESSSSILCMKNRSLRMRATSSDTLRSFVEASYSPIQ